jgi:hypothetical protein
MAAPEDVTELIDIEAVCLEVREDRGLLRRKALGRLDQPAAVGAVAGGQLDEQANPGAHPFGLRLAGLGAPRGRPNRGAWHVARLLGQAPHAAMIRRPELTNASGQEWNDSNLPDSPVVPHHFGQGLP